jgi:hypothetical protein
MATTANVTGSTGCTPTSSDPSTRIPLGAVHPDDQAHDHTYPGQGAQRVRAIATVKSVLPHDHYGHTLFGIRTGGNDANRLRPNVLAGTRRYRKTCGWVFGTISATGWSRLDRVASRVSAHELTFGSQPMGASGEVRCTDTRALPPSPSPRPPSLLYARADEARLQLSRVIEEDPLCQMWRLMRDFVELLSRFAAQSITTTRPGSRDDSTTS